MFNTDVPSKSERSQRGLFHKKTHHKAYRISFSYKHSIHTQKPNIKKKKIKSDILN